MYEDVDEDEKTLQEALALSRVPDKKPEEEKKEEPKPDKQPTTEDVAIDQNFLEDVINELGIDVDPTALDDLMKDDKPKDGDDKDKDKK